MMQSLDNQAMPIMHKMCYQKLWVHPGGEGGASVGFPIFPLLIHPSEKFYEKSEDAVS